VEERRLSHYFSEVERECNWFNDNYIITKHGTVVCWDDTLSDGMIHYSLSDRRW
jgi:hypothetical protein